MGAHFRLRASTACGVDGQRELHEWVSAIPEGVMLTGLNPRKLETHQGDTCQPHSKEGK